MKQIEANKKATCTKAQSRNHLTNFSLTIKTMFVKYKYEILISLAVFILCEIAFKVAEFIGGLMAYGCI